MEKETFNIPKENFSEWYEEILKRAEIVDKRYPVKGMDVFLPYGYAIHENIMRILEEMWEESGHQKVLFPTLIPEDIFKKEEEHIKGFGDEVFWVARGGARELEVKLLIRPTSEVPMYYMFREWIRSHTDLPLKIHQTCTVFRYETKATKSLIRLREIPWNEAHSVHATWEEADRHVKDVWKYYKKLVNEHLAISGLQLLRPEWDKFHGADYTTVMDALLPDGRVLQIVGNHHLGEKFAKAFEIKYEDANGEKRYPAQASYGVSTRLTAAMLSIHGDKKGLIIPFDIAPIQIIIVPILYKGREAQVNKKCWEILKLLKDAKIRVKLDDRDKTPGEKFYFWEMKGVPFRIEIGPKDVEKNVVTLVRRDTGAKTQIEDARLLNELYSLKDAVLKNLRKRAEEDLNSRIKTADTVGEVKKILEERMIARAPFCSRDIDAAKCAETLKEKTGGGQVRGTLFPNTEVPKNKKCIICGKPAKIIAYIAKTY